jgi:hypothetical protein
LKRNGIEPSKYYDLKKTKQRLKEHVEIVVVFTAFVETEYVVNEKVKLIEALDVMGVKVKKGNVFELMDDKQLLFPIRYGKMVNKKYQPKWSEEQGSDYSIF